MSTAASSVQRVWYRRLQSASLTSLRDAVPLCAFNALIDKRIKLSDRFAPLFHQVAQEAPVVIRKSQREFTIIDSPQSLAALILSHLKSGKAAKVNLVPAMADWLEAHFGREADEAIGGQAGIIANQVAVLGGKPVLYSPQLSPHLAKMFVPRVRVPVVTKRTFGDSLSLEPISHQGKQSHATQVNWIIEFQVGDTINFGGEHFVSPRSNKLILSSKQLATPQFDSQLLHLLPELGSRVNAAIVSGYHKLQPTYEDGTTYQYYLAQQEFAIEMLRSHNSHLPIHLEYVAPAYKQLVAPIYQHITKHVDSLGLNEIEIIEIADQLGFDSLGWDIVKKENAFTLYNAAEAVFNKLQLKRLHLHNLGYHLILLRKPISERQLGKQINAALFSSLAATTRAMKGSEITRGEVARGLDVPIAETAFDQLALLAARFTHSKKETEIALSTGVFDRGNHYLLLVPGQNAPTQAHVVGLGDTVSSCAFLAGL